MKRWWMVIVILFGSGAFNLWNALQQRIRNLEAELVKLKSQQHLL